MAITKEARKHIDDLTLYIVSNVLGYHRGLDLDVKEDLKLSLSRIYNHTLLDIELDLQEALEDALMDLQNLKAAQDARVNRDFQEQSARIHIQFNELAQNLEHILREHNLRIQQLLDRVNDMILKHQNEFGNLPPGLVEQYRAKQALNGNPPPREKGQSRLSRFMTLAFFYIEKDLKALQNYPITNTHQNKMALENSQDIEAHPIYK